MTITNAKSLPSYKPLLLLEHTNKIFYQNKQTTVLWKGIRLKKSFIKIYNSTFANTIYNSDLEKQLAIMK